MPKFGTIVLVPFPFTDLSATKVRPALVISRSKQRGNDVIACFITSKKVPSGSPKIDLPANESTGLKVPSSVRLDKIATLDTRILLGELGSIPAQSLKKHRDTFLKIFGF